MSVGDGYIVSVTALPKSVNSVSLWEWGLIGLLDSVKKLTCVRGVIDGWDWGGGKSLARESSTYPCSH